MSDNSALIRQKRNQKSSYQSSKNSKQSRYDANAAKLQRLYRVKAGIIAQKGYAEERYKGIKSYVEGDTFSAGWTGNKADSTKTYMNDNVVAAYKSYVKSIDVCLDSLCDEITRLENENSQLSWDILHLGSLINNLTNEIEKLFN